MSRKKVEVTQEQIQKLIDRAEKDNAFKNRFYLYKYIAETKEAKALSLTPAILYLREREFDLKIKTPRGRKGYQSKRAELQTINEEISQLFPPKLIAREAAPAASPGMPLNGGEGAKPPHVLGPVKTVPVVEAYYHELLDSSRRYKLVEKCNLIDSNGILNERFREFSYKTLKNCFNILKLIKLRKLVDEIILEETLRGLEALNVDRIAELPRGRDTKK